MRYCTDCGRPLDGAAFCPSCGSAALSDGGVRLRENGTDTAERPAVVDAPVEPEVPSNARFPLYADEAGPVVVPPPAPSYDGLSFFDPAEPGPARVSGPLFAQEQAPPARSVHRAESATARRPPSWVWPTVGAVGLALVAATLWWALGGPGANDEPPRPGTATTQTDDTTDGGPGSEGGATGAPGDDPGTGAGTRGREVAGAATAVVPAVAPANADLDGRPVTYGPDHLFDGDPTTTWRMPGDGTGSLIVIRLAEPTEVREVGLVNGYAKTAVDSAGRTVDWYPRNRRVLSARWSFDDGTVVDQRLHSRPVLQRIDVGNELTRTIRLRLLEVSPPQAGPLGRNYTAISEISVLGTSG